MGRGGLLGAIRWVLGGLEKRDAGKGCCPIGNSFQPVGTVQTHAAPLTHSHKRLLERSFTREPVNGTVKAAEAPSNLAHLRGNARPLLVPPAVLGLPGTSARFPTPGPGEEALLWGVPDGDREAEEPRGGAASAPWPARQECRPARRRARGPPRAAGWLRAR